MHNNTISRIGNMTGNMSGIMTGNMSSNMTDNSTLVGRQPLCDLVGTPTYIFASVLIVMAIVATIENTVVITAMCKYKALRTPSMLIIGTLASADLLTSSIVIPLYAVVTLNPGVPWQKANRILMVVIVLISLFIVVFISIDRFLHIYYLHDYQVTRKKLCCGLVIFCVTPFLFHSLVRAVVNRNQGREAGRFAGQISLAIVILLSFITIIVAYVAILMMLKKHARQAGDTIRQNYLENQKRAAKSSLLIVLVVIAMNSLAIFYAIFTSKRTTIFCTMTLGSVLGSSMVNPLVYCFRMPLIRRHILMLFGREPDEIRERMLTQSTITRAGSLTLDQNLSVKVKKNKDSVKLVKL